MISERLAREALELFDSAFELDPAERLRYMQDLESRQPEIAAAVRELLGSSERMGDFLAQPAMIYAAPIVDDVVLGELSTLREFPAELKNALGSRYDTIVPVGGGGMASVFRARDLTMRRDVAIKVMRPEFADGVNMARFAQEIEVTAALEHPRVAPIYDASEAAGFLYYVMRYLPGGALRARIKAKGQLPVPLAVSIASDVAEALQHAHDKGVVHRDIKPENVLLDGDRALVADFGIARCIDLIGREKLTRTGIMVGTAPYMSPEQASPGAIVDERTDQYALACVLYEMLTGEPPYTGPSHGDIVAKHISASIPDIRVLRRTVPENVRLAVERALQKSPADRFESVAVFARALRAPVPLAQRVPRALVASIVVVLLAMVTAATTWRTQWFRALTSDPVLNANSIAVFPFSRDSTIDQRLRERQILGDAFRRWRGITVVDEVRLAERMSASGAGGGSFARLSSTLGAGRYVRGEIMLSAGGDSLRLHAGLYDTRTDSLVRDGTIRIPASLNGLEPAAVELTALLLFGTRDVTVRTRCVGTTIPEAYEACSRGLEAMNAWRLAAADSLLLVATSRDPEFTAAWLELAQLRQWNMEQPARWRTAAEHAVARLERLDSRARLRAEALAAAVRGDVLRSCQTWERLVASGSDDFASWYGLGSCLRSDDVVIRDDLTRSGWRFRSSHHRALVAYQRAFELRPAALAMFTDDLFRGVREMFVTSRSVMRRGRSDGSSTVTHLGRAAWQGDTLAFIPFPADEVRGGVPRTLRLNTEEAAQRQRRVLADAATSWVASNSDNATAMEALGYALEMLGDAKAAVDTLRRARSMGMPVQRLRIMVHEVWLQLKFAIPDDIAGMRSARLLADSLLRLGISGPGTFFEGLAAVTGRASLAASLAVNPAQMVGRREPAAVVRPGLALMAYSALGGPSDSLRRWENQLARAIRVSVPAAEQQNARRQWSARAATLAYPDITKAGEVLVTGDDRVVDALLAMVAGDSSRTIAYLDVAPYMRMHIHPSDFSFDGMWPEFVLLWQLGRHRRLSAEIDAMLSALPETAPMALADVAPAGTLVRTMVLRADLAQLLGDTAQMRRWSRACAILWSDADPFLQPTVVRIRKMSE